MPASRISRRYEQIKQRAPIPVPFGAALNNYAVVKGATQLQQNCLVAQRAYLEDAWLGIGANVQENCFVIQSRLEERNVTAHGGKVICVHLGKKVFVGFNSFLRGSETCRLRVGEGRLSCPTRSSTWKPPWRSPQPYRLGLHQKRPGFKRTGPLPGFFFPDQKGFPPGRPALSGQRGGLCRGLS